MEVSGGVVELVRCIGCGGVGEDGGVFVRWCGSVNNLLSSVVFDFKSAASIFSVPSSSRRQRPRQGFLAATDTASAAPATYMHLCWPHVMLNSRSDPG